MRRNPPAAARSSDPRHERAQVMVETAIAFPIQMVITLAIMQYCLIAGAKQVVTYAAHSAARAEVVGLDPHRAASTVCSPIAGSYRPPGAALPIVVPGRGVLPHSEASQLKTSVAVLNPRDDGDKRVVVRVTHHYELIIPFVEYTPFVDFHLLWGRVEKLGPRGIVHKVMTETVTLPQPWDHDVEDVDGHPIIPDLSEADEP
ncbi:MAG: TadE/TadG family type IV pilus assembly protein [Candidatus Brocadiia bacterium]